MELLGAKEVSDITGVPVGTLRYWRHSDIGPVSIALGRESCTSATRFCDGSRSARAQPDVEAATLREVRS